MASQTVNKVVNQLITLTNLKTLDASSNPAQGVTYNLNVVSGDPTGLVLNLPDHATISCVKVGAYSITLTATNAGGKITTDAAGDTDGTADVINVTEPAPASQSWTYS
jgi:hypothetical protein